MGSYDWSAAATATAACCLACTAAAACLPRGPPLGRSSHYRPRRPESRYDHAALIAKSLTDCWPAYFGHLNLRLGRKCLRPTRAFPPISDSCRWSGWPGWAPSCCSPLRSSRPCPASPSYAEAATYCSGSWYPAACSHSCLDPCTCCRAFSVPSFLSWRGPLPLSLLFGVCRARDGACSGQSCAFSPWAATHTQN